MTEQQKIYKELVFNEKSGKYVREEYLIKHQPKFHELTTDFNNEDILFRDKCFLYLMNIKESPRCQSDNCDNRLSMKNNKLKQGFPSYCSPICMNKATIKKEKTKLTHLRLYGHESHNSSDIIKNRKKETYLEKYGVESPSILPKFIEKSRNTRIERYGENYNKIYSKPKHIDIEKNIYKSEPQIERLLSTIDSNKYILKKYYASKYTFHHKNCNSDFIITSNQIGSRNRHYTELCTVCNPIKSFTSHEKEIFNFLKKHKFNIEPHNRNIIKPKELDIYLPDNKIGIEFNGIFWHSDKYLANDYHIKKHNMCVKKGVELITTFEDEFIDKKQLIFSHILKRLNKFKKRITPKKHSIIELNQKQATEFLELNHIFGSSDSDINIGLTIKNKIVSIVSFKSLDNNEFLLERFTNKKNIHINNSENLLFKYFLDKYDPQKIIGYSDIRYSDGSLYNDLGFKFIENTKPKVYYIKHGVFKRHNKDSFINKVVIPDNFGLSLENEEFMNHSRYNKIYDCGSMKYEWVKPN